MATISIGSNPAGLAISADGSKLWVANSGSTNYAIGVIDLNTLQRLASISAPMFPNDIEEGVQHRLFVSMAVESTPTGGIMQIDADTRVFQRYMNGGFETYDHGALEISPDRTKLFFGELGSSILDKFDVSTSTGSLLQTTRSMGDIGNGLRISRDGQFIVYTISGGNNNSGGTFKIPTSDITATDGTFQVGAYPGPAVFSNDGTLLYHSDFGTGRVVIFDTTTFAVVQIIPLSDNPNSLDLAIDRSGRWLFVGTSNYPFSDTGYLQAYNTGRIDPVPTPTPIGTPTPSPTYTPIPTPTPFPPTPTPSATPQTIFDHGVARLAADPQRSRLYGTVSVDNTVVVVDTDSLTVVTTIPVGPNPQGLAISADGAKLWVANSGSTSAAIGVIDLNTLQQLPSFAAPNQPYDVEEGSDHRLFVSLNSGSPGSGGIMQIDAETGMFQRYMTGPEAFDRGFLEITPDRNTLLFGMVGGGTLEKFDVSTATGSLVQQADIATNAQGMKISRNGQFIIYPGGGGNGQGAGYTTFEVPTSNIASVNGSFVVGAYPGAGVFSNDCSLLYHGASGTGRVIIFDAATFVALRTIPLGNDPLSLDLAIDRTGHWLFIATQAFGGGGALRVADTGRLDSAATPPPTPTPLPATPARALNISTRMRVETGDNVLIGGFIVSGTSEKRIAVRGIGPSLTQFGVPDALADPTLELHDSSGALLMRNDNWRDDFSQAQQLDELGLGLADLNESGLVTMLQPGAYTAILAGKNGGTGVGLVEAYDADQTGTAQLANISTRGFVLTDSNVMIGGFILGGTGPDGNTRVAIRGIGPSLTQIGISPALADPTLELHNGSGTLLMSNDNWQDDPVSAGQLTANGLALSDPNESGIFTTLPPGPYTAILAGNNGDTGIGLVEVYNLQ
jgi:YVTN family beta-propeller protein